MSNMDKKLKYLERELWIMAWNASVQRVVLYKKGAQQNQRDEFARNVKKHVKDHIIPQYRATVEASRHCENIRGLIEYANGVCTGVLGEDGYKYGVAQKLLNLALKYYWCLGLINEPPHCPVDRIVIDKTYLRGKMNWTEILTERQYLDIIRAIKTEAEKQNCSIAQWELSSYERRGP